jgi:hypothetical protein
MENIFIFEERIVFYYGMVSDIKRYIEREIKWLLGARREEESYFCTFQK